MLSVITITILSVLCVALLALNLFRIRNDRGEDMYREHLFSWLKEEMERTSYWEKRFRAAEQINRKDFVLSGEILHTVTHYTDKENYKYARLISSIGGVVRACRADYKGTYLGDRFISGTRFNKLDTRGLPQPERDAIDKWFGDFVNDPDRNPLELLLLAFELMCCDDAGTAIGNTEKDPLKLARID